MGRPNVGKSTLFNRLVGKRLALVDDRPGVTRDRREGDARLGDLEFTIIDTAGFEEAPAGSLPARMREQTDAAIAMADVVLLLVDARSGLMPLDKTFGEIVRKANKPTILVANKSEGKAGESGRLEAYELGLGTPIPLSAEHGEGLGDLYDALREALPDATEFPVEDEIDENAEGGPIRVAIIGRPNAGKSTLINRLLGEERLLTGPEAGITRDSIAVRLDWNGQAFQVHDTAGIRKRANVQEKLEKLSVADALRAIKFAEVVVLLLDAMHPFEEQDLRLADLVVREGRALVIAMNKWDLIERKGGAGHLREEVDHWLPQVKGVPIVAVSGLSGENLDRLMKGIVDSHEVWNKRIGTSALNRWLTSATSQHPPPAVSGRRIKINYVTQPKARPPSFVLFTTRADAVPEAYRRYLINSLRESFELPGTPIRLMLREKENPFDDKSSR
ncbi:GTP-binding protein [Variibacter gotjawalensis]|nr:GTP-binding protein [Variibacter gotjawalensis]